MGAEFLEARGAGCFHTMYVQRWNKIADLAPDARRWPPDGIISLTIYLSKINKKSSWMKYLTSTTAMPGSDHIQSVVRACDLLARLAGSDGMRLQELSAASDLKPPTLHNLLRTLAVRGFARQDHDGRWRLGPALRDLAGQDEDRLLITASSAALLDLAGRLPDCLLSLSELVGDDVRIRLRLSPDRPGEVQHPDAHRLSIYGSAGGLAILAFGDQGTAAHLRERHPFEEEGAHLWRERAVLETFLLAARREGALATPFPQQEVLRVAAPVHGPDGRFRAAVGAALPVRRQGGDDRARLLASVREAATTIATRLA